jgi:hypothetical protein
VADLLQQASAWLDRVRKANLAHTVTYQRGEQSVDVAATVGRTEFEGVDAYGAIERTEARDFLVLAADLVLAGTAVLPEPGDCIREAQDGKTYVYEVMAPAKEPCWKWSDPYRRTLRIHTKEVGIE